MLGVVVVIVGTVLAVIRYVPFEKKLMANA